MCEIMSEGHSAKHGASLISSIFGRHIAVSFSETPPPAPPRWVRKLLICFFIHSLPDNTGLETGQSITPTRRDSVDRERPVGKQQSIPNPLHCRQQHVLTVKIVLCPKKSAPLSEKIRESAVI